MPTLRQPASFSSRLYPLRWNRAGLATFVLCTSEPARFGIAVALLDGYPTQVVEVMLRAEARPSSDTQIQAGILSANSFAGKKPCYPVRSYYPALRNANGRAAHA